jgi:hypothetical protein
MYTGLHVKYRYCCQILTKLNSEITEISNLMQICPVGAELFHADRRIHRHDEANSRFSQFCERAQKFIPFLVFFTQYVSDIVETYTL